MSPTMEGTIRCWLCTSGVDLMGKNTAHVPRARESSWSWCWKSRIQDRGYNFSWPQLLPVDLQENWNIMASEICQLSFASKFCLFLHWCLTFLLLNYNFRDEALDTVEEIIDFIDTIHPQPTFPQDIDASESVTRDFFSKFCFFIKSVSRDSLALESSLIRLDGFLSTLTSTFLSGDTLSHLDCEMLPKLHHLRVAAAVLKGYHIPSSLTNLWRYLHHGYNDPVFNKSCPPDQEIVLHWADRPDTPTISLENHNMLTRYRAIGHVKWTVISYMKFLERFQSFPSIFQQWQHL